MGPFRWLAHLLARIFHGLARALEGGRVDPLDAATAALAERFPGAPDHWLRYIAARAPHLAATRAEGKPVERVIDDADSPPARMHWWWSRADGTGDAPLRLAEAPNAVMEQQEPVTVPERRREIRAKQPPSGPLAKRRARLRIVGGKPASSATPPTTTDEVQPKSEGELKTAPRERARRPGLRIATVSERSRAELYLDVSRQMAASPELLFGAPRDREPIANQFAPSQRDRVALPLDIGEQSGRPAPDAPASWTSSPHRPDGEFLLSAHRTARTGSMVSWGAEGRRRTVDQFPSSETGRSHWPELLPPEPTDIDNAPAPVPDMARLRDEQDFGAWSG